MRLNDRKSLCFATIENEKEKYWSIDLWINNIFTSFVFSDSFFSFMFSIFVGWLLSLYAREFRKWWCLSVACRQYKTIYYDETSSSCSYHLEHSRATKFISSTCLHRYQSGDVLGDRVHLDVFNVSTIRTILLAQQAQESLKVHRILTTARVRYSEFCAKYCY